MAELFVGLGTDRNYLEWAAVLIASLAQRGDIPDAKLVIAEIGLTEDDKHILYKAYGSRNIDFVSVPAELKSAFGDLSTTTNWSSATWLRVLLPYLLRDRSGKFLYLDSDIVVNRSLRPLF